MTDLRPALPRLAVDLARVAEEIARPRRIAPAALVELIRSRCDLTLLAGSPVTAQQEQPGYPRPSIGSGSQISDALLLDQHQAGAVTWATDSVPVDVGSHVAFILPLAMGNGSAVPQPTVTWALDLEGREVARFCLVKGSRQWHGTGGILAFFPLLVRSTPYGAMFGVDDVIAAESTFVDGYVVVLVPRDSVVQGRRQELRLRALSEESSTHWARIGIVDHWYPLFTVEAHFDALVDAVRAREPRRYGDHQLLFGDLHSHSGESQFLDGTPEDVGAEEPCGIGTRSSMFEYARDIAGLDFFCLSEHDWQMNEHDWKHLVGLNDAYLSERFVTIHGFEWTSQIYGHRNVYFRGDAGSLYFAQDPRDPYHAFQQEPPAPTDLWAHLRAEGRLAITIPHHMSAAMFPLDLRDFSDPDFDRVAEIYSNWGDSLEHGQPVTIGASRVERLEFLRTIRDGYRIGFIGSSDSHDAHPGNSNGSARRPQLFHHLGSGRAGVFASDGTREAIFDGLHSRRAFAATGDGLAVWTTVNTDPMGSETRVGGDGATFSLDIDSELPISTVTVYRNGVASERVDALGACSLQTTWTERRSGEAKADSVFVKVVRSDGEIAWSTPHWLV